MTHPPKHLSTQSLSPNELRNQPIPQAPDAERGLIGCLLYGAKSDDIETDVIFNEGRQLIVVTIDSLQHSGSLVSPKSTSFHDLCKKRPVPTWSGWLRGWTSFLTTGPTQAVAGRNWLSVLKVSRDRKTSTTSMND